MSQLITPEIMQESKKLAYYEDPRYISDPFFLEAEMLNHEVEFMAENIAEQLLNEVDMNTVKNAASNVGNAVSNTVSAGVNKAKDTISNVANNQNVRNAVNTVKQTATTIGSNLKATIQAIIKWCVEKLTNFRKLFMAAMSNINKRIETNINKINPNSTGFNNTVSWYNDYNNIKGTIDKLIEISNNIAGFDISSIATDTSAANNITNLFGEFETIKNNLKNILSTKAIIANQANEINSLESLKSTSQDIFNSITNINKAVEAVNGTLSKATNMSLNDNSNNIKQPIKQFCNMTLSLVNTLKIISINLQKTLLKTIMVINGEATNNTNNQQQNPDNTQAQPNDVNNQPVQQQQNNNQNAVANECAILLEYVNCFEYAMNKVLLEAGEEHLGPSVTKVEEESKTGKGTDMGASNAVTNVSCNATYEQALNKLFYGINEGNDDYGKEFEKMMKDSSKSLGGSSSSSSSSNNNLTKDLDKAMSKLEVADSSENGSTNNSYLK